VLRLLRLVLCALSFVIEFLVPGNNLLGAKNKTQSAKYKVRHSIDILSAAAVAHGAKIKESTVNELSK